MSHNFRMEPEVNIRRRILNDDVIDEHRPKRMTSSKSAVMTSYVKSFLKNIFPPADWIRSYRKSYLPGDVISGLTVSMIRLPQVNGIITHPNDVIK